MCLWEISEDDTCCCHYEIHGFESPKCYECWECFNVSPTLQFLCVLGVSGAEWKRSSLFELTKTYDALYKRHRARINLIGINIYSCLVVSLDTNSQPWLILRFGKTMCVLGISATRIEWDPQFSSKIFTRDVRLFESWRTTCKWWTFITSTEGERWPRLNVLNTYKGGGHTKGQQGRYNDLYRRIWGLLFLLNGS